MSTATAPARVPGHAWAYAPPAELGFDAEALAAAEAVLREAADGAPYRAVVVRGGEIAAEWLHGMDAETRIIIHSTVKSIHSCLLAIAVEEGRVPSFDSRLADIYPEALDVPEGEGPKSDSWVFPKDRGITLRQLIANTSGYMKDGEEPGRVFHYQTYGMNVLAHAIGRAYGLYDPADPEASRYHELIESRIARPIGASWGYGQRNFELHAKARLGVFGYTQSVETTAHDLARLGLLWCRRGAWGDKRLVPADWLLHATSTSPDILAHGRPEERHYGYGFWSNDHGLLFPGLPRDGFAAWGSNRKTSSLVTWVCPSADLVVALAPVPWFRLDERNAEVLGAIHAAIAN